MNAINEFRWILLVQYNSCGRAQLAIRCGWKKNPLLVPRARRFQVVQAVQTGSFKLVRDHKHAGIINSHGSKREIN